MRSLPRFWLSIPAVALLAVSVYADSPSSGFKAGVARQVITPTEPLWMAGYGNRDKPAQEKEHDLWVKALALEDAKGGRLVLVGCDLCGLPRTFTEPIAQAVSKKSGLPRECLLFNCSHTHCGPVINDNLADMYPYPPEMGPKIDAYTQQLRGRFLETILAAIADLKPARISVGQGQATFAVNRRQVTDKGVINGFNPGGPVDHSVPVLRVETPDGQLRAVAFGYACHNTTMPYYKWSGDYAGFAQIDIEAKHPGAVAIFWIGCGGDANPLPRQKIELCQKYGKMLADGVEAVLAKPMTAVTGQLDARYALVDLPFEKPPTREKIADAALSKSFALRQLGTRLLKSLEKGGTLPESYPYYPVQAWRLGQQATWIALGGETLIAYNLRLKKELAGRSGQLWIAGYSNDVVAYIPSAQNLKEGGYEPDSSQVYYGFLSKWSPVIEDRIVGKVHELVDQLWVKK
jgi:hypothetical protein